MRAASDVGHARFGRLLAAALTVALAACGSPGGTGPDAPMAAERGPAGAPGRAGTGGLRRGDVERALADERDALAELDRRIADADGAAGSAEAAAVAAAALRADRQALAAAVAELERCLAGGVDCPPSLETPAAPAGWDATSGELTGSFTARPGDWPAEAARLERAACGCRSADCVAWVLAELDRWERALPPAAEGNDVASGHVTDARGCLWRRLGR